MLHTLKTWRQFLPLSFKRLSNISIISTKSFLWHPSQRVPWYLWLRCCALVVSHLCDLVHLCARRSPRIVWCRIPDFSLRIWVTFRVIFCHTQCAFSKMLHSGLRNPREFEGRMCYAQLNVQKWQSRQESKRIRLRTYSCWEYIVSTAPHVF